MRQHLPKVFSPRLDIQHKHLLQRKRQFHKIIPLEKPRTLNLWILSPHLGHFPPIWRIPLDPQPNGKGNTIIPYAPRLFCESGCNATGRMGGQEVENRSEEEAHEDRTEESNKEDPCHYKGPVSGAFIVEACLSVEVGEGEEFFGVRLLRE